MQYPIIWFLLGRTPAPDGQTTFAQIKKATLQREADAQAEAGRDGALPHRADEKAIFEDMDCTPTNADETKMVSEHYGWAPPPNATCVHHTTCAIRRVFSDVEKLQKTRHNVYKGMVFSDGVYDFRLKCVDCTNHEKLATKHVLVDKGGECADIRGFLEAERLHRSGLFVGKSPIADYGFLEKAGKELAFKDMASAAAGGTLAEVQIEQNNYHAHQETDVRFEFKTVTKIEGERRGVVTLTFPPKVYDLSFVSNVSVMVGPVNSERIIEASEGNKNEITIQLDNEDPIDEGAKFQVRVHKIRNQDPRTIGEFKIETKRSMPHDTPNQTIDLGIISPGTKITPAGIQGAEMHSSNNVAGHKTKDIFSFNTPHQVTVGDKVTLKLPSGYDASTGVLQSTRYWEKTSATKTEITLKYIRTQSASDSKYSIVIDSIQNPLKEGPFTGKFEMTLTAKQGEEIGQTDFTTNVKKIDPELVKVTVKFYHHKGETYIVQIPKGAKDVSAEVAGVDGGDPQGQVDIKYATGGDSLKEVEKHHFLSSQV